MIHAATVRVGIGQDHRARLREIISGLSIQTKGDFKLSSGRRSDIFFDMKKTMMDPEGADLLADEILDILESEDVDYIGGIEVGAIPLVSQVCVKSARRIRPIRAFFVRKQVKDHGTNKLIEGYIKRGAKVVIFDDVTTTGSSVMKAVNAARSEDCEVLKVITVVDRLEGAAQNLADQGIKLVPLFTKDDFIE